MGEKCFFFLQKHPGSIVSRCDWLILGQESQMWNGGQDRSCSPKTVHHTQTVQSERPCRFWSTRLVILLHKNERYTALNSQWHEVKTVLWETFSISCFTASCYCVWTSLDLKRVEDGLDKVPEYLCKLRLVEKDNLATLLAMIALSAFQSSAQTHFTMLFCS